MMAYLDILEAQLAIDEGKRNKMYLDSKGIPTIGIGHNLRDNPISDMAVRVIFEDDVANAEADAKKLFPSFDDLTPNRKAVIINMMFNMGYHTFSTFTHTIAMINSGQYIFAADAMLESEWAKQVGDRAKRLSDAMRSE
jgi:lysozyme